jgi:DNA-binding transcriptional regulator LsrR (DeoR family)|tara:strand:- start:705 stop:1670 length:966 start_codon:yes stop_codon:yes gene_type:complete
MSRYIKLDRIDLEEQLLVRLAWACEVEGMTQSEAAKRYGVTRLRVNKALAEARRRGILRVSVDSVFAAAAPLEWELEHKFRLMRVIVVPSPQVSTSVTPLVAAGLGAHLGDLLKGKTVTRFGMSWGNTLNLATRHMQPLDRPDLEVVSMMGGVSRGSDVNGFEITTRLADLCNAQHSLFPAPLYAGSPESQALFMEQDVIAEMLTKIRSCDAIALATGDLHTSLLVRDALPKTVEPAELMAMGGVGDITGHILNAAGELLDHPLNRQVIGLTLDEMAQIKNVILAAGGIHKVPVIGAALKRGFVDTLVTDENTAQALLEQP